MSDNFFIIILFINFFIMEKITKSLHPIMKDIFTDKPLYSQENVKDKVFDFTIKELG
jgi:hypothetical protein